MPLPPADTALRDSVYRRFALGVGAPAAVQAELTDLRRAAYEARLTQISTAAGLPFTPRLTDSTATARLLEDVRPTAFGVIDSHNTALRGFLAQLPAGLSEAELIRRVKIWQRMREVWKGEQIALTEGYRGLNAADMDVVNENTLPLVRRVVPLKAKEIRCHDLIKRGWMQPDEINFTLPLHPRCVVAGTRVMPLGALQAVSRSAFTGDVIEIHVGARDVIVAVTPNHPVLTRRGWVAAQLINERDELVYYAGAQRTGPDFDDVPVVVDKIFAALSSKGSPIRFVPAAGDFNGDGHAINGEVEIVSADSLLLHKPYASLAEHRGEQPLVAADVRLAPFTTRSDARLRCKGHSPATHSGMGGFDVGWVVPALAETYAGFDERVTHNLRRDTGLFSDLLSGQAGSILYNPAVGIFGNSMGPCPEFQSSFAEPFRESPEANADLPTKLIERFPGLITFDQVAEIRRLRSFRGHVFDLQTATQLYTASGFIVHNCAHVFQYQGSLAASLAERSRIWLGDWHTR